MKLSKNNAVELLVESVNCIIIHYALIHYALSNMLGLLQVHPLWILLFASQIWVTVRYWNTARARSQSIWLALVMQLVCIGANLALLHFVGYAIAFSAG